MENLEIVSKSVVVKAPDTEYLLRLATSENEKKKYPVSTGLFLDGTLEETSLNKRRVLAMAISHRRRLVHRKPTLDEIERKS